MVLDLITMLGSNLTLQALDLFADELDHLSAVNVDHVIVVLAAIQLIDRLATLEIVLAEDACGLELGQHPVHRSQADVFPISEQLLVDVFGGKVPDALFFEDLENAHPGMGDLQPGFTEFLSFLLHRPLPIHGGIKPLVYHPLLHDPDVLRMHKLIRTLGYATLALSLASCRLVYTPDVAQGNLFDKTIDKNLADQLKPGLTKRQVLVLLGTPSVSSPFNQNRWDYVSTYSHRGEKMKLNSLSLYFNNDVLVRTEGNLYFQDAQKLVQQSNKYKTKYDVNDTSGDKSSNAGGDSSDNGGDNGGGGPN